MAPYAKQFIQTDPELPLAWLYFGPNAWDAKKDITNRTIILPPHESPSLYDWRILRGQIVAAYALGQTDDRYRRLLAYEILMAGAEEIHIFQPEQMVQTSPITWDRMKPHEHYRR
ncbi:MAG: hypothetical protein ACXW1Z_19860 [Methylobacter sp.]